MYGGNRSRGLKFYKRLGIYKNSTGTVQYDPVSCQGGSYNWTFCAKVGQLVVFNTYRWSVTTNRHQSSVRNLVREYQDVVFVDLGSTSPLDLNKEKIISLTVGAFEKIADSETRREGTSVKSEIEASARHLLNGLKRIGEANPSLALNDEELLDAEAEGQLQFWNSINDNYADKFFKKMSLADMAADTGSIEF